MSMKTEIMFMKTGIVIFIYGFFGLAEAQTCTTTADPCNWKKHVAFPHLEERHPTVVWQPLIHMQCDLYNLNANVWYMTVFNMSSQCPAYGHCGTENPIWLNGSQPSPAEGIVIRHACVRTFDSCCGANYTVHIKNCYYYSVYCLDDIPLSCPERYCIDIDLSVITTTTTTTTTPTTTTTTTTTTSQTGIVKDQSNNKDAVIALAVCQAIAICVIIVLVIFLIKGKVTPRTGPNPPGYCDQKIPPKLHYPY